MLQRSLDRARARRSDEGFTLIELLIVIIILGILAAIVVFSVSGIKDKGNLAACKADVATVTTAEEAYYASPATVGGAPRNVYTATINDLVTAGLLHSDPGDVTVTLTGSTFTVAGSNGGQTC